METIELGDELQRPASVLQLQIAELTAPGADGDDILRAHARFAERAAEAEPAAGLKGDADVPRFE
jgi:hypothetical protein